MRLTGSAQPDTGGIRDRRGRAGSAARRWKWKYFGRQSADRKRPPCASTRICISSIGGHTRRAKTGITWWRPCRSWVHVSCWSASGISTLTSAMRNTAPGGSRELRWPVKRGLVEGGSWSTGGRGSRTCSVPRAVISVSHTRRAAARWITHVHTAGSCGWGISGPGLYIRYRGWWINLRRFRGGTMDKQVVYYACNTHPPEIDEMCRARLSRAGVSIVAVSLNQPLDFGDVRLTMSGERGPLMMHRQILAGLRAASAEYVFLCESDVFYSPSHFELEPAARNTYYYNTNVWRVRWADKFAVWTDDLQQVSGVCASRDLLLAFYSRRLEQIEREGFNRHYEPGIK